MKTSKEFFIDNPDELWIHNTFGTCIFSGGKKYMYLPYWIEVDIESNHAIVHKLGELPLELKKLIEEFRYEDHNRPSDR